MLKSFEKYESYWGELKNETELESRPLRLSNHEV